MDTTNGIPPGFAELAPLIASMAPGTCPSYPDRLIVALLHDDRRMVMLAESQHVRDLCIQDLVSLGVPTIRIHCGMPDCDCTSPTILLNDDFKPVQWPSKRRRSKARRRR